MKEMSTNVKEFNDAVKAVVPVLRKDHGKDDISDNLRVFLHQGINICLSNESRQLLMDDIYDFINIKNIGFEVDEKFITPLNLEFEKNEFITLIDSYNFDNFTEPIEVRANGKESYEKQSWRSNDKKLYFLEKGNYYVYGLKSEKVLKPLFYVEKLTSVKDKKQLYFKEVELKSKSFGNI